MGGVPDNPDRLMEWTPSPCTVHLACVLINDKTLGGKGRLSGPWMLMDADSGDHCSNKIVTRLRLYLDKLKLYITTYIHAKTFKS